jgi:hypothetical protein
MDPMQIRLSQALYRERLAAAEQARQQRATWVAAPGLIDRLRRAIGARLIGLERQVQAYLPAGKSNPRC